MKNIKTVSTAQILPGILWRCLVRSFGPSLHGIWYLLREHGGRSVENIDLSKIIGVDGMDAAGLSLDRLALVAATKRLRPKTAFEIGTYLGETTLALARNNPQLQLYTLDLPDPDARQQTELEFTDDYLFARWDRGSTFRDTPEAARIQCLQGDSAKFDFSPYGQDGFSLCGCQPQLQLCQGRYGSGSDDPFSHRLNFLA